jgi:pimeloyl-ACP methyl ester carboxylesterase
MADVDEYGSWERLTRLLDDDELLWPLVRVAAESGGGGEAWAALLDGLDDAGALAYLDAEDTGMELADALAQLPRVFRLQPDLDEVNDTDDLADAMIAADRLLAGGGFRLIELPDDDDEAHALAVVEGSNLAEILRLSAELGRPVRAFG